MTKKNVFQKMRNILKRIHVALDTCAIFSFWDMVDLELKLSSELYYFLAQFNKGI